MSYFLLPSIRQYRYTFYWQSCILHLHPTFSCIRYTLEYYIFSIVSHWIDLSFSFIPYSFFYSSHIQLNLFTNYHRIFFELVHHRSQNNSSQEVYVPYLIIELRNSNESDKRILLLLQLLNLINYSSIHFFYFVSPFDTLPLFIPISSSSNNISLFYVSFSSLHLSHETISLNFCLK